MDYKVRYEQLAACVGAQPGDSLERTLAKANGLVDDSNRFHELWPLIEEAVGKRYKTCEEFIAQIRKLRDRAGSTVTKRLGKIEKRLASIEGKLESTEIKNIINPENFEQFLESLPAEELKRLILLQRSGA